MTPAFSLSKANARDCSIIPPSHTYLNVAVVHPMSASGALCEQDHIPKYDRTSTVISERMNGYFHSLSKLQPLLNPLEETAPPIKGGH